MMAKTCIFCNLEPETKTREHVIPQWLIRLTNNDTKRKTYLGTEKKLWAPFKNFVFPACEKCNNDFSKLENKTQPIVKKLLSNNEVEESESNILLDWFDKIRIGLWHAELMMDKKTLINPRFGIAERIGKKNRILIIVNTDKKEKGINYYYPSSKSFKSWPSTILFRINHLLFISISNDFFASKKLGFDYIDSFQKININGYAEANIQENNIKKIQKKIVEENQVKHSITIAQALSNGEKQVYFCKKNGIITPFGEKRKIVLEYKYDYYEANKYCHRMICNVQFNFLKERMDFFIKNGIKDDNYRAHRLLMREIANNLNGHNVFKIDDYEYNLK